MHPSSRPFVTFHNKLAFLREELLAPRPTHQLEGHPLSALRDYLFNIFAATIHMWRQREIGWVGMDWIDLAQDMDQWRALVNTVMNLRVS
jgi:hypothetical protein